MLVFNTIGILIIYLFSIFVLHQNFKKQNLSTLLFIAGFRQ